MPRGYWSDMSPGVGDEARAVGGADLRELEAMTRGVLDGPSLLGPSPFWKGLSERHRKELEAWGFDNFKRTLNTQYFNWRTLGILVHQWTVFRDWLRHPDLAVLSAEFPDPSFDGPGIAAFDPPSAWLYKTFVAMYADLIRRMDPLRLMERLEEPDLGNPFTIVHRRRRVSQDLCNSLHEFYSVRDEDPVTAGEAPIHVMELGAGYGRLAFVFLSTPERPSYTIVDIPPALYVSQRYLTAVLPDVTAFRYRPWTEFEAVRNEFEAARLRFLLPHQASLLPARSVDIFINISSLHEMTRDQVTHYFKLMDTLCRGKVYVKQWRRSRTPVNGVTFSEYDYPIPPTWRTRFHRRHPIQRWFFEALYDVG
jgi:putative sugar O-methyltransferase